jgi:hypothetical protein
MLITPEHEMCREGTRETGGACGRVNDARLAMARPECACPGSQLRSGTDAIQRVSSHAAGQQLATMDARGIGGLEFDIAVALLDLRIAQD